MDNYKNCQMELLNSCEVFSGNEADGVLLHEFTCRKLLKKCCVDMFQTNEKKILESTCTGCRYAR